MVKEFKSTNNLPFEVAPWISYEFTRFKIGTCHGLWRATKESYDILVIDNDTPGNGHLEDVFDWFYNSCIRDNKKLRILELWNEGFKNHLINKKGFVISDGENLEKSLESIKRSISEVHVGAQL